MKRAAIFFASLIIFCNLSMPAMAKESSIRLSRDVTRIEDHKYEDCVWLEHISFGIAQNPYIQWINDPNMYIPIKTPMVHSKLEYIGDRAFYNTSLKGITIDINVAHIGEYAIGFTDHVTSVGELKHNWQVKDFKVYGMHGTIAEQYAKENNFIFVDCYDHWTIPYCERYYTYVPGDYDDDDAVSIEDAQLCLKEYTNKVAGLEPYYGVNVASDVNNDNVVDVKDAQLILKYYTYNNVADDYVCWRVIRGLDI